MNRAIAEVEEWIDHYERLIAMCKQSVSSLLEESRFERCNLSRVHNEHQIKGLETEIGCYRKFQAQLRGVLEAIHEDQ